MVFMASAPGAPEIELTYNWGGEDFAPPSRSMGHLAYATDDIYALCESLQAKGIVINRPPRDGKMAFVKSPDGISVELLQKGEPLEASEPWASMEHNRLAAGKCSVSFCKPKPGVWNTERAAHLWGVITPRAGPTRFRIAVWCRCAPRPVRGRQFSESLIKPRRGCIHIPSSCVHVPSRRDLRTTMRAPRRLPHRIRPSDDVARAQPRSIR